ncbi:MAG: DsbA family protein [Pseudomonadota bacterium]|nr:DsbA family protein [Pseudomonadota bacterium]
MKPLPLLIAAAAIFATAACDADQGNVTANAADIPVTATPVAAPNNGDWSTIVSQTPEGGFVMGNPDAQVKLVEYGSMTCPHCADFDETGLRPLIENYVKKGLVSFEFRNFVRDPYDITAALVARCGGPSSFFGLTRAMYADQANWIAKVQAADPAAMQALQSQPPQAQFKAIADLADFPAFAAMRGVPRAKTEACLADPAGASRLVEMNSDAAAFKIPGTPSFLINGELVESTSDWKTLEPAIKSALNS